MLNALDGLHGSSTVRMRRATHAYAPVAVSARETAECASTQQPAAAQKEPQGVRGEPRVSEAAAVVALQPV